MWWVAGVNINLEIQLVKIKCLLWKKSSFFSNEPFKSPVWRKNSWKFHFCHCSGVSLLKWGFTAFKYNLWISIILVVSKVTLAWKKTDFFQAAESSKLPAEPSEDLSRGSPPAPKQPPLVTNAGAILGGKTPHVAAAAPTVSQPVPGVGKSIKQPHIIRQVRPLVHFF